MLVDYGPYELQPDKLMIMPAERGSVKLPPGRLITAVRMETSDGAGRPLEREFICHNNVGPDFARFEHGRKMLLDGYTREIRLPDGFAMAPQRRDFLTELMYNNPGSSPLRGVKTRFTFELAASSAGLTALYPQMLSVFEQPADVAAGFWGYYVLPGAKDSRRRLFDVLQDYRVHHVSFHIHDRGRRILLKDLSTGVALVDARPVYEGGKMAYVPQISVAKGLDLRRGTVLELTVDYDNPGPKAIDAMGAAILFGRCLKGAPDCEAVAQRPADNAWFDAKVYYPLIGETPPAAASEHARHHRH